MSKSRWRRLALCLITWSLCARNGSANDGYFDVGYGVKSRGMGGAGIAFPQDALAVAANPAGDAFVGSRLDVGGVYYRPLRGVTEGPSLNLGGNERPSFFFGEGGVTLQLGEQFTIGLAVYHNGGVDSSYRIQREYLQDFFAFRFGLDLQQVFIAPSISFKITPQQAIGIAPIIANQSFSTFGLENLTTDQGRDCVYGAGVRIGYTGKFFNWITAGVTWESRISMGRLKKYTDFIAQHGSFDIPSNFGGGLAFDLSEQATFTFDVEEIVNHRIAALNSDAGFGWRDVTVVKAGVSYDLSSQITLRAGYNYCTPVMRNDQTIYDTLAPAVVQHHVTGGISWRPNEHFEISAYYLHGFQGHVVGMQNFDGDVNIHASEDSCGLAVGWIF